MHSARNSTNTTRHGGSYEAESSTTQLDFDTAMADFHTMFPDMDKEVIEAVLRANQGAVDATIDQLLSMSIDIECEKSKNQSSTAYKLPSSAVSTQDPAPEALGDLSKKNKFENKFVETSRLYQDDESSKSLCNARGWKTMVLVGALPPDFLRLDRRRHKVCYFGVSKVSTAILKILLPVKEFVDVSDFQQYPSDADDMSHITMLLQSPEFVEMIKKDRDFMMSLDKGQDNENSTFESYDGKTRMIDDDMVFRSRLAKMGRVSRRQLTQLARIFFRGTKFPMKHGAALKERSILCDDDDEDDTDRNKSQNSSQNKQ